MSSNWWLLICPCPTCKGDANVLQIGYSADGELKFFFFCPKCNKPFDQKIYDTTLRIKAKQKDEARDKRTKPQKQLPPINGVQLPPFSEDDIAFLKKCNIKGD
jgi:hypothetical protein